MNECEQGRPERGRRGNFFTALFYLFFFSHSQNLIRHEQKLLIKL